MYSTVALTPVGRAIVTWQLVLAPSSSTAIDKPEVPDRELDGPPGQAIDSTRVGVPDQVAEAVTVPPPAAVKAADAVGGWKFPGPGYGIGTEEISGSAAWDPELPSAAGLMPVELPVVAAAAGVPTAAGDAGGLLVTVAVDPAGGAMAALPAPMPVVGTEPAVADVASAARTRGEA